MSERFAFIRTQASTHAVTTLCRVLAVSKAGYYAWCTRAPSARAQADAVLTAQIRRIHHRSHRTYGSPRVQRALRVQGVRCSRKRVARLMRHAALATRCRRRRRTPRAARGQLLVAPNALARQFAPVLVAAPNRVWAADFTFISTRAGWLYLAVVLDLYSRRVIGWSMHATQDTALVLDALTMALDQRRGGGGVLHHSDRGQQYTSTAYRTCLAAHGLQPSMSDIGACWDNAVVESFFATLKTELVAGADWRSRDDARAAVFLYIEGWYNRQRQHSTLDYVSPMQFERQYHSRT